MTRFELEFHPLIEFDIEEALNWYEKIEPRLANRLEADLDGAMFGLETKALLFRPRFADIRRVNPQVFQYGIYYFISGEKVVILGILHAARDTEPELRAKREAYF